jgi:hypothetical protein
MPRQPVNGRGAPSIPAPESHEDEPSERGWERDHTSLNAAQPTADAAYDPGSSAISRSLNHDSLRHPSTARNRLKQKVKNSGVDFQNGIPNAL